ncbi:TioE family transcriptional regulator [Streptomyces shenzhenensis]
MTQVAAGQAAVARSRRAHPRRRNAARTVQRTVPATCRAGGLSDDRDRQRVHDGPGRGRPRHLGHAHSRRLLALLPGHGHPVATSVMRAVNQGAVDEAFRLIDESHAQLSDDRRTLQAVERALRGLEPTAASHSDTASGPDGTFIGPLAEQLGIRPATLRKWEHAGLVRPRRDSRTGYRVYDKADVRDARLAHQLRRGGYLLEQIAPLIAQVRTAGGLEPLEAALGDWRGRLSARGRAMLAGAAELEAYLRER